MSRPRDRSLPARVRSLLLAGVLLALVVAPVAVGLASTPVAAQDAGGSGSGTDSDGNGTDIVVRQGDRCFPIEAYGNGSTPVTDFYDYRSPYTEPTGWYHAYGELERLLREDTSQILLYNGSEGLSLVFENDGVTNTSGSGGTVTVDITGLPAEGNWSVRDDSYPGQDDVFDLGEGSAHIEWYWNKGNRSDGAAFVGLESDDWEEITIDPAFNEASPGYPYVKWDGSPESNEIERWVVRSANATLPMNASGDANASEDVTTTANATATGTTDTAETTGTVEAGNAEGASSEEGIVATDADGVIYSLDMSEPVTIARGPCDDEAPSAALAADSRDLTPGTEVAFDASGSADNDAVAGYRWDVDGDGTIETVTNESTLDVTYDDPGAYEPRVTVVDRANNTANASVSVQVEAETTTTTTTTTTATPTATATATATATEGTEGTTMETRSPNPGGTTDTTSTPATDGGSSGDSGGGPIVSGGIDAAVDRASAVADRASEQLTGMESANLIGLAVLSVALLIIGLVVLRR